MPSPTNLLALSDVGHRKPRGTPCATLHIQVLGPQTPNIHIQPQLWVHDGKHVVLWDQGSSLRPVRSPHILGVKTYTFRSLKAPV